MRARFALALGIVATLLIPQRPLHSQDATHDVLRGRVRGPDSAAIRNATVSVLSGTPGAAVHSVRTDSIGEWSILLDGTAPTYTVTVTALGMAPLRITARRTGEGQPITVDAVLKRASVQLEPVRVTETRRRPPRRRAPTRG